MAIRIFFGRLFMPFARFWERYCTYAESVVGFNDQNPLRDLTYWRKKLLSVFTIYFVPVSFIALIPGLWMSFVAHLPGVALVDTLSAVLITVVLLSRRIRQPVKNGAVIAILYLLAVMLIVSLGLFGPGVLYLYGISVFMSVMFNKKYAYWSVVVHFFTCAFFAVNIYLKILPFAGEFALGSWIAFSSNLIFLSIVSIMLISSLISGLEVTVKRGNELNMILSGQNDQTQALNKKLTESVSQYKGLFYDNPLPMWVLEAGSLRFLEVNKAALAGYGYSQQEFGALTIKHIRRDDTESIDTIANEVLATEKIRNMVTRHSRKNGDIFPVRVQYNAISYQGRKALLGIAEDISEQVSHMESVEEQNRKLTDIAFIQSHLVRAPLARILGLTDLLSRHTSVCADWEEVIYLRESANELDSILLKIIRNTEQLPALKPITPFEAKPEDEMENFVK